MLFGKETGMRTSLRKRQISVFAKILTIFIVVIFPLYIFSIQINMRGQNDVRREIIRSAQSRINFYISSLDMEFFNIIKMQSRLILNEDVLKLSSPVREGDSYQQFDQYKSMNNVRAKLDELVQMNSYISEAVIYMPSINRKISSKLVQDMPLEEFQSMKSLIVQKMYPFSEQEGQILINMTPGLYSTAGNEDDLSFIISVRVSKEKLEEVLGRLSEKGQMGALLMGNRGGLNISVRDDSPIIADLTVYLEENADKKSGLGTINTSEGKMIVSFERSSQLSSTLIIYTPEEKFLEQLSRYKAWLWIMSILLVVMVALFTLWIKGMISRPLDKLINAFKKVEDGDFHIAVKYKSNDEFGHLYKQFNDMFNRLRTLIEQVYEQKILVQNAELKQLQYQINPHFLYNSLLIIYSLVKMGDSECAMKLAQHMGNYYQYITRSSSEEVPLVKEITHAKDYVGIQRIRFSNRIKAEFEEIPEGMQNFIVPRLIVQPIIENSYNHGLKDKIRDGILKVQMQQEQGYLSIFVEDNGEEMKEQKLAELRRMLGSNDPGIEKSGLLNVHRRLQIKYGSDSGIHVSQGEYGGLRVEIRIKTGGEVSNV
jgi:two-component system, sensor histidine kinase YesM